MEDGCLKKYSLHFWENCLIVDIVRMFRKEEYISLDGSGCLGMVSKGINVEFLSFRRDLRWVVVFDMM
jgi:hypothetical protein